MSVTGKRTRADAEVQKFQEMKLIFSGAWFRRLQGFARNRLYLPENVLSLLLGMLMTYTKDGSSVKRMMSVKPAIAVFAFSAILFIGCDEDGDAGARLEPKPSTWVVNQKASVLQIGYGTAGDFPQYAALHLKSSYFRMVYGRACGWGTSAILLPSFWSRGVYFQGAPVTADWEHRDANLVVSVAGTIGGLQVEGEVVLSPPLGEMLIATVSMRASGEVALDPRTAEAFKPVMLSSMRISDDAWDARSAFVGAATFPIPESGRIIQSPRFGILWGLHGGTSRWKQNAPTVQVEFDRELEITGWVTPSNNPNDDNVGFWGATQHALASWSYTLTAKP